MLPLLLISAAMADARPVTPNYEGNCQAPSWSADGSRLAFEVNYHKDKRIDLFVYEPGKGDPRPVLPLQRGSSSLSSGFATRSDERVAHEASWAPAFINRMVYSASTASKDYDLFIDGAATVAPAPGTDGSPAWSPDGHWIVFTSARTGEGDLYLLDVHNIEQPPRRLSQDARSSELYAAWAPDSKAVVYVGHTQSGDNIYVIDDATTGTAARRLTSWPHTQTRPSWSPDGKQVAFYSNHEDTSRFDLYVVASSGGVPKRLAQGVVMSAGGPSWTPDGTRVVYVKDDDDRFDPIYVAPVGDPSAAKRVRSNTVGNVDLDVTRGTDGQTWLAVSAQGLESDEVRDYKRIYVMTLPE